jgi:hypothetical protein
MKTIETYSTRVEADVAMSSRRLDVFSRSGRTGIVRF